MWALDSSPPASAGSTPTTTPATCCPTCASRSGPAGRRGRHRRPATGSPRRSRPSSTATPPAPARTPARSGPCSPRFELDKAMYEVVYEARNRPGLGRHPARRRPPPHRPLLAAPHHARRPVVTPTPSPEVGGAITALVQGRHQQPHDLLGQHLEPGGLRLRVLKPLAQSVRVRFEDGEELELAHEAEGVWTAVRTDATRTMDYRLLVAWADGIEHLQDDPYRFVPTVGEVDLHLIGEGRHEQLWRCSAPAARVRRRRWATCAATRSRSGRRNARPCASSATSTTGTAPHAMRLLGDTGVWELFVPGIGPGTLQVRDPQPRRPCAQGRPDGAGTERPPATASVVTRHEWGDGDWMDRARGARPAQRPDERLRGAPGLVAAGPGLPRARRPAHRVRRRAGLHARRVHARRRAPLRRLVGLPGHRLLRADLRFGTPTTSGTSSTGCTGPASA